MGEWVGDDEVVASDNTDAELPDRLLRSHGRRPAGTGFSTNSWLLATGLDGSRARRGDQGAVAGWRQGGMDAANSCRPAPGFIGDSAEATRVMANNVN